MLATIDSPIITYTLTRIAQFKPNAHKVSIAAIHACNDALDADLTLKRRCAAIQIACRAMDEYAAMERMAGAK